MGEVGQEAEEYKFGCEENPFECTPDRCLDEPVLGFVVLVSLDENNDP